MVSCAQGFQDVFSKQIQVPPLPPKAQFAPVPAAGAASQMPGGSADMEASLGYSERQRVLRERQEAAELEKRAQAVRGSVSDAYDDFASGLHDHESCL